MTPTQVAVVLGLDRVAAVHAVPLEEQPFVPRARAAANDACASWSRGCDVADELSAELELSIDAALASVTDLGGEIETTLSTAADVFSDAMASAISAVPDQLSLDFSADPTDAQTALFDLQDYATATPVDVPVTADTTEAQGALDDLAASGADAGGSLDTASGSANNFGQAASFAAAGAGLARGQVGGLESAVGGLSGGMGTAVGVGAAFGASIGFVFEQGVQAQGSLQRFNSTLGNMRDEMQTIDVGSLHADLSDLAISLGTDDEALMDAASSIDQFAKVSGASDATAEKFSETLIALAARAVAMNPSLGSVATVADSMSVKLARGGRFAAKYGLDLNAAEINTRALGDTGKTTAADLTIYEKAAAAAAIATEKYGDSIGGKVKAGTENAIIVQRRLKEEFNNVIEAVGKTLVIPMFDLIEKSLPVVEQFAGVLGTLARGVLPVLAVALEAVAVPLGVVGDVLNALPAPVLTAVSTLIALRLALGPISSAIPNLVTGLGSMGAKLISTGTSALTTGASLGTTVGIVTVVAGAMLGAAYAAGYFDDGLLQLGVTADDVANKSMPKLTAEFRELRSQYFATATAGEEYTRSADGSREAEQAHQAQLAFTKKTMEGFNDVLAKSPEFAQKYIDAATNAGVSTGEIRGKLAQYTEDAAKAKLGQDALNAAVDSAEYTVIASELSGYNAALAAGGDSTAYFSTLTKAAQDAVNGLQSALLAAAGGELGYEQAVLNVDKAQADYNDTVAKFGPESAEATASHLSLQQAQLAAANASLTLDDSQKALLDSVGGTTEGIDAEIARLQANQREHPKTAESINPLIYKLLELKQKIDEVPPEHRTLFEGDTADIEAAVGRARTAIMSVTNLPGAAALLATLPGGGGFVKQSRGGFVEGSGYTDSVPTLLTPGEYVMTRSQVNAARTFSPATPPTGSGGPVTLSPETINALANALRGNGGITIENASFGDRDVLVDLDYFWARTKGAGV